MGIIAFIWALPSAFKKYMAYAGALIVFIILSFAALHRRDRRMVARVNLKASLKKEKELHDIRKNQLKAAARRPDPDSDDLERMLDDGDF